MIQININEAKSRLSKYTKLVKAGETVILCERNKPFAEIRPLDRRGKAPRIFGLSKGVSSWGRSFLRPMLRSKKCSPGSKKKKAMPGTYLLDTAPLIYLMGQEQSVPASVRRELADPKSEVFYSQISLWEIQIKYQLGKLPMSDEPAVALPRELARYGFTKLDLTDAAIYGLSRLPLAHKDPFDRILIIQAKLTGSTLVSPDKNFSQYPVNVRWG